MKVIITHGLVPSVWALFGLALVAGGAGVCDAFQVGPSASSRRQTQPAGIVGIPLGLAVTAKTTVLFLAAEGGDGDKKKEKDELRTCHDASDPGYRRESHRRYQDPPDR